MASQGVMAKMAAPRVACHFDIIACMENRTVITGHTDRPPHNTCPDYRKNACPLLIVKSEFLGYNG